MKLDISSFTPEKVLYEFDGPLIFTVRDADGSLLLAYQCGEDEDRNHYFVVPFDDERLADLTEGRMPVLEALSQPWAWHAMGQIGELAECNECSLRSLPEGTSLPHHSVMLWPSLEPLLSFRMVGENIRKGNIPGAVVKQGIAAPTNAISGIAEYLIERMPEAEKALQCMMDVRVQRITYASFDVGFKAELPQPISDKADPAAEMKRLLTSALDAASQADYRKDLTAYFHTEEEGAIILDAVRDLTPPTYGIVSATQVGGRLVSGGRIRSLTREARRYVNERTGSPKERPETIQQFVGLMREMDLDKSSFILREIQGVEGERKFKFADDWEDEVNRLWNERAEVSVVARVRKHRSMALVAIKATGNADHT
jgi:hypothetical protein